MLAKRYDEENDDSSKDNGWKLVKDQHYEEPDFKIQHLKIAVLGSTGSGKTSVIKSFVNSDFSELYKPTTEYKVYNSTVIMEQGRLYDMQISDLAPMDEFPDSKLVEWDYGLINSGLRNADIYLIVFDLTSLLSYQWAQKLAGQIWASRPKVKLAMCGNKYDLYLQNKNNQLTNLTPVGLIKGNRKSIRISGGSSVKRQQGVSQSSIKLKDQKESQSGFSQSMHSRKTPPRSQGGSAKQSTGAKSVPRHKPPDLLPVENDKIKTPTSSPVTLSCGNSPSISPFPKRFTFRYTTIGGTTAASIGGSSSGSRHSNRRHTWQRKGGRPHLTTETSSTPIISHFVPCSAKFNWRITAVFREIVDALEREPNSTSSPSIGSPSLFCFADSKHISRSNSDAGSKFSSLSGTQAHNISRRTTEATTSRERPLSNCSVQ